MRNKPLCNLLRAASPPAPQGECSLCGLASRPAPARTQARLAERGWPRSEEKEKRKELRAAGARCMALSTARELLAAPGCCSTGLGLELLPQPQRSEQGPSVSAVNRCCALTRNIYLVGC